MRRELQEIKREHAPGFKTIEELLATKKEDIHKLSTNDLFRVIQYFNPEFKIEADLTDENLEKMVKGEYP
jgi:hypothetical protein